jgi:hypothetical protein
MARYRSRDNTAIRKKIVAPRKRKTKLCVKQAAKDIFCLPDRKINSNLGMTVDIKQHSKKEKLVSKKYIGVCRRWSTQVMVIMSVLPVMEAKYASRCTSNRTLPRCWTAGKPSRMNSWTAVLFLASSLTSFSIPSICH